MGGQKEEKLHSKNKTCKNIFKEGGMRGCVDDCAVKTSYWKKRNKATFTGTLLAGGKKGRVKAGTKILKSIGG